MLVWPEGEELHDWQCPASEFLPVFHLCQQINQLAAQNSRTSFGERFKYFCLLLVTLGHSRYECKKDKCLWPVTPLPDELLQKIQKEPLVSERGLDFLARTVAERGFVSISEGLQWVLLECQLSFNILSREELPGAGLLLERYFAMTESGYSRWRHRK